MRRFGLLILGVLATTQCGGGDGGNGPPTITAVVVSGDSTVVLAGTRQLTAAAFSGGTQISTGVTFLWTSADTILARVSVAGLVTGRARGTVTISAHAVLNGTPTGVSGTHALRVRIGSVALTPSTTLQFASLGDTLAVTAEARDAANAPVAGITFTAQSRNTGVVQASAANATTALVVAAGNGTTQVVVTGDGVSDSVTAAVQQIATTLSITPDTVTFGRIDSVLTPVITANDARGNPIPASALNWTSLNTNVATVNPTTGAITSKNEPSTRVIATSGSLADTVRIGVVLIYGSVQITLGGLTAPIDTALITQLNGTRQLGARVLDIGGTQVSNPQVVWDLKDSTIAAISNAGLVTGGTQTGTDTVIVVARTVSDRVPLIIRQDVATVAVTPASPADLNFVGDTQRFSAEAFDGGGSAIPGKTFVWSTSRAILGIAVDGLATADSATSSVGVLVSVIGAVDGKADTVAIRVKQVPNSANLDPSSFGTLTAFGRQAVASCVVEDSAADTIPNHPCNWAAGTPDVVTFSPTFAVTTTITAVGNGSTTITAEAAPSLFGFNSVTVDQVPATVTVTPTNLATNLQLRFSQTAPFSAVVRDTLGNIAPDDPVTWSTTNATVADVDPATGVVTTATTAGSVTITATASPASTGRTVDVVATGLTLNGSVQPILTGNCASAACHDLTAPQEGMSLVSGQTFGNTVDIAALQLASMRRVRPFRPDSSYLVHKIQGTQASVGGVGARMPEGCAGASCLPNSTIDIIRNWILQGALN